MIRGSGINIRWKKSEIGLLRGTTIAVDRASNRVVEGELAVIFTARLLDTETGVFTVRDIAFFEGKVWGHRSLIVHCIDLCRLVGFVRGTEGAFRFDCFCAGLRCIRRCSFSRVDGTRRGPGIWPARNWASGGYKRRIASTHSQPGGSAVKARRLLSRSALETDWQGPQTLETSKIFRAA